MFATLRELVADIFSFAKKKKNIDHDERIARVQRRREAYMSLHHSYMQDTEQGLSSDVSYRAKFSEHSAFPGGVLQYEFEEGCIFSRDTSQLGIRPTAGAWKRTLELAKTRQWQRSDVYLGRGHRQGDTLETRRCLDFRGDYVAPAEARSELPSRRPLQRLPSQHEHRRSRVTFCRERVVTSRSCAVCAVRYLLFLRVVTSVSVIGESRSGEEDLVILTLQQGNPGIFSDAFEYKLNSNRMYVGVSDAIQATRRNGIRLSPWGGPTKRNISQLAVTSKAQDVLYRSIVSSRPVNAIYDRRVALRYIQINALTPSVNYVLSRRSSVKGDREPPACGFHSWSYYIFKLFVGLFCMHDATGKRSRMALRDLFGCSRTFKDPITKRGGAVVNHCPRIRVDVGSVPRPAIHIPASALRVPRCHPTEEYASLSRSFNDLQCLEDETLAHFYCFCHWTSVYTTRPVEPWVNMKQLIIKEVGLRVSNKKLNIKQVELEVNKKQLTMKPEETRVNMKQLIMKQGKLNMKQSALVVPQAPFSLSQVPASRRELSDASGSFRMLPNSPDAGCNLRRRLRSKRKRNAAALLWDDTGVCGINQCSAPLAKEIFAWPHGGGNVRSLSGTIPTCENLGATSPEIEPGLPWWEANEDVNMEQCWNEGAGETGYPRDNPLTREIVRCESHLRKSGVNRPGIEPGLPWWEASSLTAQPPCPPFTERLLLNVHT
ncbi:hypothetical protein PR048_002424 [Dryococelus australis]|uniref:Uncharacterized protein n=1 Tax=Dryococelus australis TaxID=614101 RepID=A0ABQ9IK51_9NEOP|nr:hypothetical protein PR048_002424 [Dryococelus australis]